MQKQKSNDMCKCCNIPMKQHSEGNDIRFWFCPVCGYKQYVTKFDKEGSKG